MKSFTYVFSSILNTAILSITLAMVEDTTAKKMKFFFKDFFSKCGQNRSLLRIWLHLLKKSLKEKFIFCAVHTWK